MKKGLPFFLLFLSPLLIFSQAYEIDPTRNDSALKNVDFVIPINVRIVGNKVTKEPIILREITFQMGDTIAADDFLAQVEQSKKNILNTSLFNFTKIDYTLEGTHFVQLVIQVEERWYLFPAPIFEIDDNNFNTWWRDKDYSRINYGFYISRNNFRGRKEKLSLTAQYGFTERYRLKYEIPYINKNRKAGLNFSFSYNRRDEIVYTTFDNERLLYKSESNDAVRNLSAGVIYQYRNAIFTTHSLGLEYDYNSIQDSVRLLNPNYLGNNQKLSRFFTLFYDYKVDKRDSRNYPLKGFFFNFNVRKYGLGIVDRDIDLTNFQLNTKKFWKLKERWFLASGLRGVLTANNNQPYLLQNGLGYSSFGIRAFEYYVIDGHNIGLGKVQLRYQIVKPNSKEINFIPLERFNRFHYAFYLGVFSDFAYVDDNVGFAKNDLANELLSSFGIGLDFVTYYDIVIRTEYSINKFGESGIFIHFVAPI